MELQITGKNVEVQPEVRQYIERKLNKLDRHLHSVIESQVEITEEKTKSPQQRFVAQVTVQGRRAILRGEERGGTMLEAIDKVAATVERQAEHQKGKLYSKKKGSPSPRSIASAAAELPPNIVKVKRFPIEPMSVAEAIDQMESLGHDFFLFLRDETEALNLVYRRKDGNYGLIEPESR
jgi:putative sigma-54 modulation protein